MQRSSQPVGKQRRVSLAKHREEIELWVSQGRSDEWIADALGTSQASVQSFRSRNKILRRRQDAGVEGPSASGGSSAEGHKDGASSLTAPPTDSRKPTAVYEGALDQGEEGYGLWLDPAIADDPIFREGFAGVSDVRVILSRGRIILEPASRASTTSTDSATEGANKGPASHETPAAADDDPSQPTLAAPSDGPRRLAGRVKFFDDAKGFGFITLPDGEELFFHRTEIRNAGNLESGEFVYYEPGRSQRGPVATAVRPAG